MLDKYKSCKDLETGEDCPDRIVGCHGTCEGYLARCKEREEIRKNKAKNRIIIEYKCERQLRYAKKVYRKNKRWS